MHAGPLPRAADLYEYEQVHPGLANRIVNMAEREQQHRHQIETAQVENPYRLAKYGQVYGFLALLTVLAFAAWLVAAGHPGWATAVSGLDVVGVAAVFVRGRNRAPRDASTNGKKAKRR